MNDKPQMTPGGPVNDMRSNNSVITKEYLFEEMNRFRKMTGDVHYMSNWKGIEQVERAFSGLLFVYLRATVTGVHPDTTPEDIKQMEAAFEMVRTDYQCRMNIILGLTVLGN